MLDPITLMLWALAIVVIVFAAFLVLAIILAAVRTVRKPKPTEDHEVFRGGAR